MTPGPSARQRGTTSSVPTTWSSRAQASPNPGFAGEALIEKQACPAGDASVARACGSHVRPSYDRRDGVFLT
jgi:hypothetical protein